MAVAAVPTAGIEVLSCYQGTQLCCQRGECCERAAKDCRHPVAPLLMMVDLPAALGNILQSLHDSVILAKVLGRVLLLPPFLGDQPAIDLLHLAEAFGIDIIVAKEFHWPSTCEDGNRTMTPLEVSGPRSGPFRDHFQLLQYGALPLTLGLYESPTFNEFQGVWSYERRARGDVAYEGQWWGIKYPKSVWVQSWERTLQLLAKDDGQPCVDEPFLAPDLARPVAILQAWRQHSCLEKAALKRAKTRCLVFMALVNSLHLGKHWEDHLHFFRHFRFVPEVWRAAARIEAQGGERAKSLRRPFLAIHLRPYLFRAEGLNETSIQQIFLQEVQHVFRRLRRRWGVVPDTFLASESMQENNTLRVLQLLTDLGAEVVTSEDTKPLPGGPSAGHVAIDALICTLADHFLGTSSSSLSAMIASTRFAQREGHAEVSFIPRERADLKDLEEYQLGVFPLSSSMPSKKDLSKFFLNLEAHVASSSSRNRFYCSAEALQEGREGADSDKGGMPLVNTILPFGEQRSNSLPVSRERCERRIAGPSAAVDRLTECQPWSQGIRVSGCLFRGIVSGEGSLRLQTLAVAVHWLLEHVFVVGTGHSQRRAADVETPGWTRGEKGST